MTSRAPALRIVPANEASWDDLALVFGTRGAGSRCFCQRYKLARGESFGGFPAEERAARLREQTDCGNPGSGPTSGLVAHLDDQPVGWVAVEPRPAYGGIVRNARVPWDGRDEDRADPGIWAVTCLFTRAGFRRAGISGELAVAAVDHARRSGARALEAYPILTTRVIDEELHVGTLGVYLAAGLREVSRPTPRRAVLRIDFPDETGSSGHRSR